LSWKWMPQWGHFIVAPGDCEFLTAQHIFEIGYCAIVLFMFS
jgi:hypothetical protein